MRKVLLEGATSNGAGDANAILNQNSRGAFVVVSGGLGGGQVTIEIYTPLGDTWVAVDGGTFQTVEAKFIEGIPASARIRASLTGSSGANCNVEVFT